MKLFSDTTITALWYIVDVTVFMTSNNTCSTRHHNNYCGIPVHGRTVCLQACSVVQVCSQGKVTCYTMGNTITIKHVWTYPLEIVVHAVPAHF